MNYRDDKFPRADTIEEPRYPRRYYQGFRLIRDPQEWNTKGRVVHIRKMPAYLRSDDVLEEHYRVRRKRKAPRTRYLFHPWISELYYPPKRGVETLWSIWE